MEMEVLHKATLGLASFVLLLAAASDAKSFRIPNLASIVLIALFPAFVLTSPTDIPWKEHLAVFALIFAIGYALYAKKFAGAGDIKLVSVLSLWAGPLFTGTFLFVTALAGGILSLGIGLQVFLNHRFSKSQEKLKLSQIPIPYGVAIAVGGLCMLALMSHQDLLAMV